MGSALWPVSTTGPRCMNISDQFHEFRKFMKDCSNFIIDFFLGVSVDNLLFNLLFRKKMRNQRHPNQEHFQIHNVTCIISLPLQFTATKSCYYFFHFFVLSEAVS